MQTPCQTGRGIDLAGGESYHHLGLFLLMILRAVGSPLPEDAVLILSGFLVAADPREKTGRPSIAIEIKKGYPSGWTSRLLFGPFDPSYGIVDFNLLTIGKERLMKTML
jgi:hypothetical protein